MQKEITREIDEDAKNEIFSWKKEIYEDEEEKNMVWKK